MNSKYTSAGRKDRNTYPNISTKELLEMNRTYTREYRENPTDSNRRAVESSSKELSRRGA